MQLVQYLLAAFFRLPTLSLRSYIMALFTYLETSDNPAVTAVFCSPDVSVRTSPPSFQPGDLVRPRCLAHPWRQYPIVIDPGSLISKIWLITVYIYTHTILHIQGLAEDYERSNTFHRTSSGHRQRAVCGHTA